MESSMFAAPEISRRAVLRGLAGASAVVPVHSVWAAKAGVVSIDNFTFAPTTITSPPGLSVTWTNRDDIPHSIVIPALGVHSHALDTGDTFSHRFETAGTFDYICGLHPHMHGQVVVKA